MNKKPEQLFLAFTMTALLLAGCNATTPARTVAPTNGKPPTELLTADALLLQAFSHDFNHDNVPDWVLVEQQRSRNNWNIRNLRIHLSQPSGKYQQVVKSPLDEIWPEHRRPDFSVQLVDNDSLLVTRGSEKMSDMPNPTKGSEISLRSTHLFHFVKGEFVLQRYTYGTTFISPQGEASHTSYIYDLLKRSYTGSQSARCDFTPDQPCREGFSWEKVMKGLPHLSVANLPQDDRETMVELNKYVP